MISFTMVQELDEISDKDWRSIMKLCPADADRLLHGSWLETADVTGDMDLMQFPDDGVCAE